MRPEIRCAQDGEVEFLEATFTADGAVVRLERHQPSHLQLIILVRGHLTQVNIVAEGPIRTIVDEGVRAQNLEASEDSEA